jgi:hypothetical protein
MNLFLGFEYIYFFHHLLEYCDMSSEIIQNVAYDNYDGFQHVNFVFSQYFISLFWGLFNNETDLKVRYSQRMPYHEGTPLYILLIRRAQVELNVLT